MSYRMLHKLSTESWAQDALDMIYLEDEVYYTKEMFDEGVLPEVGTLVPFTTGIEYLKIEQLVYDIDSNGDMTVIFKTVGGRRFFSEIVFPKTEKTKEEKVVDYMVEWWQHTFGEVDKHIIKDVYEMFKVAEENTNG